MGMRKTEGTIDRSYSCWHGALRAWRKRKFHQRYTYMTTISCASWSWVYLVDCLVDCIQTCYNCQCGSNGGETITEIASSGASNVPPQARYWATGVLYGGTILFGGHKCPSWAEDTCGLDRNLVQAASQMVPRQRRKWRLSWHVGTNTRKVLFDSGRRGTSYSFLWSLWAYKGKEIICNITFKADFATASATQSVFFTYYSSPDHSKKNLELYHFKYHLRYIHAPSVHAPMHWCTSRFVCTKAWEALGYCDLKTPESLYAMPKLFRVLASPSHVISVMSPDVSSSSSLPSPPSLLLWSLSTTSTSFFFSNYSPFPQFWLTLKTYP